MQIAFSRELLGSFERSKEMEWWETNGLGGWAGSTLSGAHSRRYHGLLVAATNPPVGRVVLLSKLEETIVSENESYELGCNSFPGAIHPQGYRAIHSFEKTLFPVFEYRVGGINLRKTIAAIHGENTTVVIYEVLQAPDYFWLKLHPLVAARDFHSLVTANPSINQNTVFSEGVFRVRPYEGVPELFLQLPGCTFVSRPEWHYRFEYQKEQDRGLDFQEDLFSYGTFKIELKKGAAFGIIASTMDPSGREAVELLRLEKERRLRLLHKLDRKDSFAQALSLAADQFIVRRGQNLSSIIAGYPWFSDWGRDAMIALPGLCLVTKRFSEAKEILTAFADYSSQGMLPNHFPDREEPPEYNTVDASLWFFIAVYHYLYYTGDSAFVRQELLPVLKDTLDWYTRGTRYGIHVDADGLLHAGEQGVQLTWMDAKIGEWVVTPRSGKAVEINALWYNALRITSELLEHFNDALAAEELQIQARNVKQRFEETFWYAEGRYLFDTVAGEIKDSSLRPNQILALGLPFPLVEGDKARKVLKAVQQALLTPRGLRSLSPQHQDYHPQYLGNPISRDSSYHQGTVWTWMLGPFIRALIRFEGKRGRKRAREIIRGFETHLVEAGLGTISEIFDGEPPHGPRGCPAQAWSVAEILWSYVEAFGDGPPSENTRPGDKE